MTKKEITKLDSIFRDKIRARDKVCQCFGSTQRCGGSLQVAHFITRSNKQVRWCMDNAALLCAGHHIFWAHKNPLDFQEFVFKRLGENRYTLLKLAARGNRKLYFEDVKLSLQLYLPQIDA